MNILYIYEIIIFASSVLKRAHFNTYPQVLEHMGCRMCMQSPHQMLVPPHPLYTDSHRQHGPICTSRQKYAEAYTFYKIKSHCKSERIWNN